MDHFSSNSGSPSVSSQSKQKIINGVFWKALLVMLVVIVASCQAQTFQYSRGWTNGKRSGSSPVGYTYGQGLSQLVDLENSLVGVPLEEPSVAMPGLHMNLNTQGRVRPADFSQFLNRRVGGNPATNNRKQPIWTGTVLGLEQENNSVNNADF
ncbi:unnamed protein product [Allacma fusca]|uniref:Pro-corazonin n=1 Tax=Allacma fusca TaxID=39272 RepID=A0A8J2LV39_9HEXA|nr:unnamed protein product [Allacma fusca]